MLRPYNHNNIDNLYDPADNICNCTDHYIRSIFLYCKEDFKILQFYKIGISRKESGKKIQGDDAGGFWPDKNISSSCNRILSRAGFLGLLCDSDRKCRNDH